MKKTALILVVSLLMITGSVFAGDLYVSGNLGVGTETPQQKLDVNGNIKVPNTNWSGLYFGDTYRGILWRTAFDSIAVSGSSLIVGDDGTFSEIYWDTLNDGYWAFCEGVSDNGASSWRLNCADYDGPMDSNDYYWVWKHGFPTQSWCTGDCATRRRDLKFVFDGESNDGVMGFMEDEDAFFFDEALGIGTRTPMSKLAVSGLPTSPPADGSTASYGLCITDQGNVWIDNDGTNDCQ